MRNTMKDGEWGIAGIGNVTLNKECGIINS